MKEKLRENWKYIIMIILAIALIALGIYTWNKQKEYKTASDNGYNMAFYELVDYVQNVETYLAKAMISTTPEHGAETLSHLWREADLAQSYLARLPIGTEELANTEKFLNQVSEYSFSLSRKNINKESLTEEDLKNLENLHKYSIELSNTLNQLSADMNDGRIKWSDLSKQNNMLFAKQVSNISQDSFGSLEENFHEYEGLIYDGAFSEHMTSNERKGLTGEDISEETAKQRLIEFVGKEKIKEINSNGLSENAEIPSYDFNIKLNQENEPTVNISLTRKGGHILYVNYDRDVQTETLTVEQASNIGKEFLTKHKYEGMEPTYYLNQGGILTINYAYTQNDITIYPDLIKVKVALDNGEVLGMETMGYLNCHTQRDLGTIEELVELGKVRISKEEAKQTINKNLEISSESLAIIPTKWQTEILCWQFKGKVDDREFLVYINTETGKEEDILIIVNTPNGILTM